MGRLGLKAVAMSAWLALAWVAPVRAADSAPNAPARAEMTDDGLIFVTPAGMTLYTYGADDSRPGTSQCTNVPVRGFPDPTAGFGAYPFPHAESQKSCAQKWPPYMADEHATPSGDWSLINRPEGGKQWIYRGHPLYLSVKDHKPGDRNAALRIGQVGRGWNFAMAPMDFPPGLKLIPQEEGLVLATANDRPVYSPHGVRLSKACDGCGEALFQPIFAPDLAAVSGDWSIVAAGAGRRQYSFKGQPLYAAPDSMTDGEIAEAGGWQTVVFRKSPGAPPEIAKRFSLLGEVYTDTSGKTLYAFTCNALVVRCDDPGDAAQYWVMVCGSGKECARRWRPYLAPANAHPVGEWSVVDVSDPMFTDPLGFTYPADTPRVKAWAYRGMPVYTYYQDKAPGDIMGNGIRVFALSGFYALQVPGRGLLD